MELGTPIVHFPTQQTLWPFAVNEQEGELALLIDPWKTKGTIAEVHPNRQLSLISYSLCICSDKLIAAP